MSKFILWYKVGGLELNYVNGIKNKLRDFFSVFSCPLLFTEMVCVG